MSKHRSLKVRRPKETTDDMSKLDAVYVRSMVQKEIKSSGLEEFIDKAKTKMTDDHEVIYHLCRIFKDMQTSVTMAKNSSGSTRSVMEELLQNFELAMSTLDEVLDKDSYRDIVDGTGSGQFAWDVSTIGLSEDDEGDSMIQDIGADM